MAAVNHELPIEEEWITADDDGGLSMYTITCRPQDGDNRPVATLTVVHGFGEHIDRYREIFQHFASKGIAVHGFDQRGFGKTGRKNGSLGHNEGTDTVMRDITAANSRIRIEGVPHFVFGHSMGGLNALLYASRCGEAEKIRGVISSAAALTVDPSVQPNAITYYLGSLLCKLVPTFKMSTNLSVQNLSRNQKVVDDYKTSHYNFDIGSLRTLKDLLDNGKELIGKLAKDFKTPVLLTHGKKDLISSCNGTVEFFDKLPSTTDKTLRLFDDLWHELHFEPESEQVLSLYVEWILERS